MNRIKVKSFLSFTQEEKRDLIRSVRAKRVHSLEEARTKKARGRTKSAIRNRAKRGKVDNMAKKATAALGKLSAAELKKILQMYGD